MCVSLFACVFVVGWFRSALIITVKRFDMAALVVGNDKKISTTALMGVNDGEMFCGSFGVRYYYDEE